MTSWWAKQTGGRPLWWFVSGAVCILEFLFFPVSIVNTVVGIAGVVFIVNGLRLRKRKSQRGDKQD